MIKGLSGAAIRIEGNDVIKWTRGKEAAPRLLDSYYKMQEDLRHKYMQPMIPVRVNMVRYEGDFCELTMPFVYGRSGYQMDSNILSKALSYYFELSCKPTATGFKDKVRRELLTIPESRLKNRVMKQVDYVTDTYPMGFCHGDLGLANMIEDEGEIYLIDYTPRFIETPLIDLATLELSLFSEYAKSHHLELFEKLMDMNFIYRGHVDLLRSVLALKFNMDSELDREAYINGRINRAANI